MAQIVGRTAPRGGSGTAYPIDSSGQASGARSFLGFLNLIRGAHPNNPEGNQYECRKAIEKHYRTGVVEKAPLSEASGLVGGYLAPQDYSDALLNTVAEMSFIYPRATVIPMFSADLLAPRVDAETVPGAGISPFFGGVQFRWGHEDPPVETEPTFRAGFFHAWDLLGYATVSNQWLQDAGAIQSTVESPRPSAHALLQAEHYLIRLFGRAAAWYAEYAFLRGTGAAMSMPLGVINSPAAINVARAGAGAIAIADIANMSGRLLPYGWMNGIWACSPSALVQIQQLAQYSINQSYYPADLSFTREGSAHRWVPRPCGLLSTLPLFITDKLPRLGQRGDLILFDPSLYVIAQRMEVIVDVSPDDLFQTNQTVYRIWLRLDGKPLHSSAITLSDLTTTVSSVVVLAA